MARTDLSFAPEAIEHLDGIAPKLAPYNDDDLERLLLGRCVRFQAMLNRSRQSIKEGKGFSEEDFWQAVRERTQQRKAATSGERRHGLC